MITLRLPVVVDAAILRSAFEAADKMNTKVGIEVFYRLKDGSPHVIDCDTESELQEFVRLSNQETSTDVT